MENIVEEIKERWNSRADEWNQYPSLGLDEIEILFAEEIYNLRFENEQLKMSYKEIELELSTVMKNMEE